MKFKAEYFVALLAFCSSVFISHFILPTIDRATVVPFFNWQLFDSIPGSQANFDLEVVSESQSEIHRMFTLTLVDRESRNRLYYLIQKFGDDIKHGREPAENLRALRANLARVHITPIFLMEISAPISRYAMMSQADRETHSKAIYAFK